MTESKTMTKEELANLHDDHCWRMSPYKEIDNSDSFIAGYEAAESRIKELEKIILKLHSTVEYWARSGLIENYGDIAKNIGISLSDVMEETEQELAKIKGE